GSWATEFVLERGKNSIPIVVTDMLGNPSEQSISVGLDQVSPLIDTVGKHGKGQFVNGGETVERVLADQNDDEALQIETSRIDLGSVGINRQSLDENKVPYFAFSVSDPDEDDVFSSFDDIAVSYQYKINDKIISDWNPFSPVENEYLVPLASQGLHTAWYKANLLDEHIVNIEVKDKAGNISDKKFSFRADFRLPETGILDENIVEDKDSADMFAQYDFSKRSELNGRTFSAVRYKYTNDTGHAIYIKPEDDEQHKLVRSYDEAVRVNKVKWTLMTEWRLNRILNVFNPTECPVASDMEPVVVTTLANYVGGGWKLETVPEEERSAPAKVASDNPIDFDTNWTGFHFDDEFSPAAVRDIPTFGDKPLSISYQYDYLVDINLLDEPSLVGGWQLREHNVEDNTSVVIKTCENVSYLEGRVRFSSPISEPGYPKSEMLPTPDPENTPFTTSGFIVNNIEEGDIAPVDGWYRIPAGHSVWIHKLVDTPDLENYTSNEVVDNLESIRSYDPLRYDKEISWQVKQQLKISAIHDAGAENVNKMSARVFSVRENEEDVSMFTISR
ncbi:MAG: hypothetical protein OEX19_13785, partial [Gammaproteobacteria bacterium]|nr:hypothetical protein [Gammaproteobacteria bacterium]